MSSFSRRYTPQEDAAILAAATVAEFDALAAELGRTPAAISTRRAALRSGTTSMVMHKPHRVDADAPPKPPRAEVFARPSWFKEDLGRLAVMKH